jgi:hypothetical protein
MNDLLGVLQVIFSQFWPALCAGEISSVNSTTSETLMPKHEGRSNLLSSVTKRLDFGAPETDLNLMEPPGSMNFVDRSGKAFVDVNRYDGEVEDGWGEIEDLNSDAKDLGVELQKMEADSHTTHVLVQLQNDREEFEQGTPYFSYHYIV